MHPDTLKLKRLFRKAKKDGETRSFKEFAQDSEIGELWLMRKMEKPDHKPKRVHIEKPKEGKKGKGK